jgi:predicted HTH domain antitoxin
MREKKHWQEVIRQYSDGKLSAGLAAEMLGISLREWYELLERKGVAIKWDEKVIRSVRS